MQTKKLILAAVFSGCLAASLPAGAGGSGIPVFDPAAIAKAAAQLDKLKEQISNQLEQLAQLRDQVKALTSKNGYGSIKSKTKELFDSEWKDFYSGITKQGGKDMLKGKNYDAKADGESLNKRFDLMMRAAKDSEIRLENLNRLAAEVDKAQDAKAAADLANRIAIERGIIAQNPTNLDTMWRTFEMQKEISEQQQMDAMRCANAKRVGVNAQGC